MHTGMLLHYEQRVRLYHTPPLYQQGPGISPRGRRVRVLSTLVHYEQTVRLSHSSALPTRTGRPSQWHDTMRSATAFHRALSDRNIACSLSTRWLARCVGTVTTGSRY